MKVKLLVSPTPEQKAEDESYQHINIGDVYDVIECPKEVTMLKMPQGGVWVQTAKTPLFLFADEWELVSI